MDVGLTRDDVVGTYAGLRPLIAPSDATSTVKVSREHRVSVEARGPRPGQRRQVHDVPRHGPRRGRCGARDRRGEAAPERDGGAADDRRGAPRRSWTRSRRASPRTPGSSMDAARSLVDRHGTEARAVLAAGEASAGAASDRPLVDGFPYLEAEVTWAVERELAQTLDDVLARRIRLAPELPRPGRVDRPRRGRDHGAAPRLGRRPVRPRGRGLPRRRPSRVRRAGMTDRTRDPRAGPGHDVVARDRLRPLGHAGRQRPARVPAGVPVARPRHPRPRGHLDEPARRRARRSSRPSAAPSTSPRSASPTSARRPSCGTAPPAAPSPRRSSGRAGSPPRSASGCAPTGHEPFVRERTGLPIDAYFSGPKIRHILEEGGPPGARRARRARVRDRGRVADLAPDRAAGSTRPTSPTRRGRCCSTSTRSTGTTTCSA